MLLVDYISIGSAWLNIIEETTDKLLRLWRYINHLLTHLYLLTSHELITEVWYFCSNPIKQQ